jgi:hypothetical protein
MNLYSNKMSKKKEMIDVFDSISNFNTYSKYSILLSKIFKKKCLKDYISSLKNNINPENCEIFKDNDNLSKINIKENEEEIFNPFIRNTIKKKELDLLHDEESFENEKNKKEKSNFKNKEFKFMTSIKHMNKAKDMVDPFKYTPNYHSIEKNIHGFKMVLPKNFSLKIKKLQINDLNLESNFYYNKKHSEEYKSYNSDSTRFSYDKGFKSTNYKTLPDLKIYSCSNNGYKTINKFNNIHIRRFSKYISRKLNIYKVNNKLTYLEPNKYSFINLKKNKSLDFKKMSKRNSKDLTFKHLLKNPPFCYYNPKYDFIEQKPISFFFNKKDIKKNEKKNMLRKICSSYDVVKEYLLIDNNKLKKIKDLNLDLES